MAMKDITISEAFIKSRIDEIISDIQDEYSSNHELCTKVINYDYYCGKLSELHSICGDCMEIITYRHDEINKIERDFNKHYVNVLYRRSRREEARMNAFAKYGEREIYM